jgi:RHS repeat-associated protein
MFFSAASNLMNQFTGKERDAETGLDYFGARYFSGAQGRFTSPDPFSILQKAGRREELDDFLSNPQQWNKYAYSLNNPLAYVDPDGKNPLLIKLAELIQRAANSPTGQRAINYLSNQGTRLFNSATQFFNSPTGQEITQTVAEKSDAVIEWRQSAPVVISGCVKILPFWERSY